MEKDIDSLIEEASNLLVKTSADNQKEPTEFFKKLENILAVAEAEKSKNKSSFKKVFSFLSKIPNDTYNLHVSDFLRLQMQHSDRHIYKLFLEMDSFESYLAHEDEYYDSKNKISLFIVGKILNSCSPKEIILFLNEHLSDIQLIEKKFFIIEIYIKLLGQLAKKELYLDQIFPLILMTFSSAIQKFIKNKEKMDKKPESITHKEIIINFDKYAITLIRKILNTCQTFPEIQDPLIQSKIMTINDIFVYSYESGEIKPKEVDPNLLLKHYLICFAMDIMEGVADALASPFFNKPILNGFLNELTQYLFKLTENKVDYITCFLTQKRYFSITKQKPASIKENIKSYDKLYSYNCLAISILLSEIMKSDQGFNLIFSLKYKLNLLIPVIFENLKAVDSKIELFLDLIKHLETLVHNEKEINEFNLFNFENLNIFNVPLSDFVALLLEQSGSFNCNEENRKILVDLSNILMDMPNEIGRFALLENLIKKSSNSNLLAYIINLTKKKIQFLLDSKTNDPTTVPMVNANKIQNLIENCLNKNKFSGISSKVELLNDIINFMIYLMMKFCNFHKNEDFAPKESHLFHINSKGIYENITNSLNATEKEIKEEVDRINNEKQQLIHDPRKTKEDKEKDLSNMEIRINQYLVLIDNLQKLREIKL